jgi:hypothetical protein
LLTASIVLVACRSANGFGYREFLTRAVVGPILCSGASGFVLFAAARAVLRATGLAPGTAAIAFAVMGYLSLIYFIILDKSERQRLALQFANFSRGD